MNYLYLIKIYFTFWIVGTINIKDNRHLKIIAIVFSNPKGPVLNSMSKPLKFPFQIMLLTFLNNVYGIN